MRVRKVASCPVSIFIAGDYRAAVEAMERNVQKVPFCVTVTATKYVHTGGTEDGVIIGLINYPRFPAEDEAIWLSAQRIAAYLCEELNQQSYTIQANDETLWVSHRPEDNDA